MPSQYTHRMNAGQVPIIGIGDDGLAGLTEAARQTILSAAILFGPQRTLDLLPASISAERVAVGVDLTDLCQRIAADRKTRKLVVLAPGDPLFYGVARYLCDRLGKEVFHVVPHVSTMQLAFARVAESWEDAYLTNAAAHPLEAIVDRVRTAERAGLFTSEAVPPNEIARALLHDGINYFRVYVCENLGTRNEIITQGTLAEIADLAFGPLNVMVLVRLAKTPDALPRSVARQRFGNPDDFFLQSRPKRGLLTPAEVRTLGLARLDVRPGSIVWDIGAGSGSVSIEAAQLATEGKVYAIEPEFEDCDLIRQNAELFGVRNVEIVMGKAPEALLALPDPDAVFVGGIGRETLNVLDVVFARLKPGGNLVTNLASLERVSTATGILKTKVANVGLLMVNLARGISQMENIRFEAVNPSFLVFAQKPLASVET